MWAAKLTLTLAVNFAAYAAEPAMTFEFNSGASHHPEGFGAWTVRWNNSLLCIAHQVRDKIEKFPPVSLSSQDKAELQKLIDAANLESSAPTLAPTAPGSVPATFRITRGEKINTTKRWVDWDRSADPVLILIKKLAELIEKHTAAKPVLQS